MKEQLFINEQTKEEIYIMCPRCSYKDITLVSDAGMNRTNAVCNQCNKGFTVKGRLRYPTVTERVKILERKVEEEKETQLLILNLQRDMINSKFPISSGLYEAFEKKAKEILKK